MKRKILVIEDDVAFGTMLKNWFQRNSFDATLCSKIADAKAELKKNAFSLVLSDLRLPDGDGIMLLEWIKDNNIDVPFIVMTSYAEVQSAVSAIKLGAEDYLQKPINPAMLREKIDAVFAKSDAKPVSEDEQKRSEKTSTTAVKTKPAIKKPVTPGFVLGGSAAARTMYDHILKVAPTRMSVLILGESGTGKEFAAKLIHDNSQRKDKPFIALDCGALSKELAPSELFGHLKGSFTSAIDNKTGVFEQANGGTVFLDEVGNLSYEVQVQLLRALQEKKIRPVGSAKDISVDVRIVAATNEDLSNAIAQGTFREDLYHRLDEFSLSVPPLRDREDDILLFANEFLSQANAELDKEIKGFHPETIKLMRQHHWSGNLRELRNVVRRAALFANDEFISPEDLPKFAEKKTEDMGLRPENEKEQIESALHKARGNKTLAAKLLKIDRKTLYNKMHLYDIKF